MPKVIIADDEEFVRYFIKTICASLSYSVVAEVDRGDELCSVMKRVRPDILFLDINMPQLTGLEFLKFYRKEFSNTCIIVLTSASSFKLMEDASNSGVNCFRGLPRTNFHERVEICSNTAS